MRISEFIALMLSPLLAPFVKGEEPLFNQKVTDASLALDKLLWPNWAKVDGMHASAWLTDDFGVQHHHVIVYENGAKAYYLDGKPTSTHGNHDEIMENFKHD